MARDPARRRDGLSDADRQWLERGLAIIVRTTRDLATLIVDDEAEPRPDGEQAMALPRLLALPPAHNRN